MGAQRRLKRGSGAGWLRKYCQQPGEEKLSSRLCLEGGGDESAGRRGHAVAAEELTYLPPHPLREEEGQLRKCYIVVRATPPAGCHRRIQGRRCDHSALLIIIILITVTPSSSRPGAESG